MAHLAATHPITTHHYIALRALGNGKKRIKLCVNKNRTSSLLSLRRMRRLLSTRIRVFKPCTRACVLGAIRLQRTLLNMTCIVLNSLT